MSVHSGAEEKGVNNRASLRLLTLRNILRYLRAGLVFRNATLSTITMSKGIK
jgi:hypothetical protein